MHYPEIEIDPHVRRFFDNSRISFSNSILQYGVCRDSPCLGGKCLLSVINIFIGIIELIVRCILVPITCLVFACIKENPKTPFTNIITTLTSIYFSGKYVDIYGCTKTTTFQNLLEGDPVEKFRRDYTYNSGENSARGDN